MLVAAYAAAQRPIRAQEIRDILVARKIQPHIAEMLMIKSESVRLCWIEWDRLNNEDRSWFMAFISRQVVEIPPEDEDISDPIKTQAPQGVLVTAGRLMVTIAILIGSVYF
ncbi:MAG: hypothetical protein KW788_01200 [Candidatus Doudnabacteria bacterium]|nr:hypothetical protein [Candidatus Doudnabacteria bacterium]